MIAVSRAAYNPKGLDFRRVIADLTVMRTSVALTVTLGEAAGATSLSEVELLAWVNAGMLPALEPGPDGIPVWSAGIVELIAQVDGFLELDLQLEDVRESLEAAGLSPWRPGQRPLLPPVAALPMVVC